MNSSSMPAYHRFSIAPMLDWTTRHCRYFHRLLTRHSLLYTEMVTSGAILYGKGDYLRFNASEQPIALQLGGCDPKALGECANIAHLRGYTEINLNVGCPSDRVQNGRFGACLMSDAPLVRDCVAAMLSASPLPVTVKTRIGIDDQDSYPFLCDFIDTVRQSGCSTFIVHARKAWLSGLSPKENREVPPLDYPRVWQLKQDFADLNILINGGLTNLKQCQEQLAHLDGVMVGRAAFQDPWLLASVDREIFGDKSAKTATRHQIVRQMQPYIEQELSEGTYLSPLLKPMLGLFQGLPGARAWRRYISEHAHLPGAGPEVVEQALTKVPE